ncbi:MAG: thiol:disulfide interchange protein DsbA/DsbL [Xanthomonadales bacterium]|jgi:thiol:disulfide interchange protein DsbA|nr:thiol:disulfide interchange protein DsbA/DsbL [Xanthomonadales bacterium]
MRILMMAALLALAPLSLMAQNSPWKEGVHYYVIEQQSNSSDDKMLVEEVFSYACPHCNSFQPTVGPWHKQLPADVAFKRLPAVFSRSWEPYARAYLTFEAMGITEETHQALFDALHRDRKPLRTIDQIADFVAGLGVDKGKFMSTANSFAVNGRLNQANSLVRRYGITGTPSLVIDGKYRIAAGGELKTYADLLNVADFLIEKRRQERGAVAAN